MTVSEYAFETDRLLAKDWHSLQPDDWQPQELATVVAELLTEPVTRSLPESWRGHYTIERARMWIAERDREGVTLLVVEKATGNAVGLMILFESARDDARTEVRLGYLLGETSWGKGFASELVQAFVRWCRTREGIASVVGGVARDNPASARVLEKNGFHLEDRAADASGDEDLYRIDLA